MKQYVGILKVWDLLHTVGWTDTVEFENKFVREIDSIIEPWIKGRLFLQTLNNTSIQITIESLYCIVNDISDYSGDEYQREVIINDYVVVCSLPVEKWSIDDIYHSYEDVYEIDQHNLTVDIENCIINAIKSQEPIVKHKNDENLWDWWIEVVDIPPL